jgi:hypothetical protein
MGAVVHELSGGVEIGHMRRFLCFWLDCARIAIRGSVVFANNWQWLFGIPIVAGILGFISAKRNVA